MSHSTPDLVLTPALEDYLETIFRLFSTKDSVRVRDIAEARGVRPGSVSPAMRRLDDLGLIRYERRESVSLTDRGIKAARSVYARHQILHRFFTSFLGLSEEIAERDACAMEHSLSRQAVDKLVRFLEYIEVCPEAAEDVNRFHNCSAVNPDAAPCPRACALQVQNSERTELMSIAEMKPGQTGRVRQIEGKGAIRQRLLDMGILPDVTLVMQRKAPTGDPVWIKVAGFEMALRRSEAYMVAVESE